MKAFDIFLVIFGTVALAIDLTCVIMGIHTVIFILIIAMILPGYVMALNRIIKHLTK